MALQISGNNYCIEWSEEELRWVGYISSKYCANIRVLSSEEYNEVITWVLHNLDEELELRIKKEVKEDQ